MRRYLAGTWGACVPCCYTWCVCTKLVHVLRVCLAGTPGEYVPGTCAVGDLIGAGTKLVALMSINCMV